MVGKHVPRTSSPNITTERSPGADDENITARAESTKQGTHKGDLLQKRRRQSMMSNYNRRTYNKETVQERGFGQFIVQMSLFNVENGGFGQLQPKGSGIVKK